jgi:hypothetical protein
MRNKFISILNLDLVDSDFNSFLIAISSTDFTIDFRNDDTIHATIVNFLKGIINNQLGDISLDITLFNNTLQNTIYNMAMCRREEQSTTTTCSSFPSEISQSSSTSSNNIKSNLNKNIKFLIEKIEQDREYDIFDRDAIASKSVNSTYQNNFVDVSIFNRRILKMTPDSMKKYFENVKCIADQFDQFMSSTSSTKEISNQFKKTKKTKYISLAFVMTTIFGTGCYVGAYIINNKENINTDVIMKKAMLGSGWLLMSSVLYYYWNKYINTEEFKEILYNYNTRTLRDEMIDLSNLAGCTLKEYTRLKQEIENITNPSSGSGTDVPEGSCGNPEDDTETEESNGNGVDFTCSAFSQLSSTPFLNKRCIIYSLKGGGKVIAKNVDEDTIITNKLGMIDPFLNNTWMFKQGINDQFLIEFQQCTTATSAEYLGIVKNNSIFEIVITTNPYYWYISDSSLFPKHLSPSYIISSRNIFAGETKSHGLAMNDSGNLILVDADDSGCPSPFFISFEDAEIIIDDGMSSSSSSSRHLGFFAKKDTHVHSTITTTLSSPNNRFHLIFKDNIVQKLDRLIGNTLSDVNTTEYQVFYNTNNRNFTKSVHLTDSGVIKYDEEDETINIFPPVKDNFNTTKIYNLSHNNKDLLNNLQFSEETDTTSTKLSIIMEKEFPGIYSMKNTNNKYIYVDSNKTLTLNTLDNQIKGLFSFDNQDTQKVYLRYVGQPNTTLHYISSNTENPYTFTDRIDTNYIMAEITIEEIENFTEPFEEVTQSGTEVSNEIFYNKLISTIELFDRCNFIRYKKADVPFPMIEMIVNIAMLCIFLIAIIYACFKIIGNGYHYSGGNNGADVSSRLVNNTENYTDSQRYSRYVIMAVMILTSIIMSYNIFKTTYLYNNQLFQGYNFMSRDC